MKKQQSNHTSPPLIYVASPGNYATGRLHGRWIDASQPVECIREEIAEMLEGSKEAIAEEWAIQDYQGFGTLRLFEFEDLETLAELTRLMSEHGILFAELVSRFGGTTNLDEARRYIEEGYQGEFDSLSDYAEQFVEDCYDHLLKPLPDFIRYNIDYDAIGRDFELGGDIFTVECDGKLHIFNSCI